MAELADLKNFDTAGATISLWVFKKSSPKDKAPIFTGRWVEITDLLNAELRSAVVAEQARITEIQEYGLLSSTNEASALAITTLETHAGLIVDQAAAELQNKKVKNLKEIQNTSFYVIKMVSGDTVMHAVRKADPTWKTRHARNAIAVLFAENQLTIEQDPGFSISRYIDFFVLGESIYISQKPNFESVLSFKAAHEKDFVELQGEPDFKKVFSDLEALLTYVGANKMQLRRASAIRQKGHYKDAGFMKNLRDHHAKYGLKLQFDDSGKIVPSLECCKDIFQALLDHRLSSGFSNKVYDVPDASSINI